ncbi:hypothetical protein B4U80_01798 [Leptotrombidium deliense]|uniref:Chromo domain-containing protein n=1 Tax=Leptotrombidium deliense TaxID=299467 RepID=A0A443RTS6_9ACAR|nr:hypothetical protein B4U80_01798 [Leptotrombidium deliense]
MFKYFTSKGTRKYIDILQNLINAYNETKHRVIKMKPINVSHTNTKDVFKNIYGVASRRELFTRNKLLPAGTTVRKQYKLKPFDKGYYPNLSDAVFTVTKGQNKQLKPTYKIKTEKGEPVKKTFYPEEIQKIKSDLFRIEKIINRKKINGKLHYFVKFLNHSDEYNEWIPANDVIKL